jgi:hypothetical protein
MSELSRSQVDAALFHRQTETILILAPYEDFPERLHMKIVLLRGSCPDRISCPNVYWTDRGTYIIQGYVATGPACAPGQAVVEIPLSLAPEIAAHRHNDLYLTDRGTVLVRGTKVTDREALEAIQLPAGEDAVELYASTMPALEGTVADAH